MNNLYKNALIFIKSFGWNSVFVKYMKKAFILFFLPCLAAMVLTLYYNYSITVTKLSSLNTSLFKNAVSITQDIFNKSDNAYRQFILENDISLGLISMKNYTPEIRSLIKSAADSSDYFKEVYLYCDSYQYVYSSYEGNYLKNFSDTSWHVENLAFDINPYIVPIENADDFYLCYSLHPTTTYRGTLIFRIDGGRLLSSMNASNVHDPASTLLIDTFYSTPQIVFSSENMDALPDKETIEHLKASQDLLYVNYQNKKCYASNVFQNRFFLLANYPKSVFSNNLFSHIPLMIVCLILSIIITFALSLFMSLQYYKTITKIILYLSPEELKSDQFSDELTYIQNNLMKSVKDKAEFEKIISEKLTLLKQTQYQALQFQFNPHFIFNCLNTINFMAIRRMHGDNEISSMIIHLSELLSAALNTEIKFISVREEMAFMKKYIEIEKIRYESKFDVLWDIDANLLDCQVIKLITQPILENAFSHGIGNLTKRSGVLKITIRQIKNDICIEIEDNGSGISQEKLYEIKEILKNNLPSEKHIGLSNVHSRMTLTYGDEYGCEINSTENGTKVSIIFPKILHF